MDKSKETIKTLSSELASVKAELYTLQTARSVRATQFTKQLLRTRNPRDLVEHLKTAPSLLRRADAPKVSTFDDYAPISPVHSPAPLLAYPNVNIAVIGRYPRTVFSQTTNCVDFGSTEQKTLGRFDSIQAVAIDYIDYSQSSYGKPLIEYISSSLVAKVLVFADLNTTSKKQVDATFANIPYSLIDTSPSNQSVVCLDIYSLGYHNVSPTELNLIKVGSTLPKLDDIDESSILYIDHSKLTADSEVDTGKDILRLIGSGVPVIFKDSVPELLSSSPVRSVANDKSLASELAKLSEPYELDRYAVTCRRHIIANYNSLCVTNSIFTEHLPHIQMKTPMDPTISVLLSTRRPDFVDHALKQLEDQTIQPYEVILMLHGADDTTHKKVLARAKKSKLSINVSVHDGDQLFGQVLNDGLHRSTGELVTKIDDDDHYGKNHLYDLMVARLHSQADIVGKWNHWVYITSQDTAISWVPEENNKYGVHLPGGTVLAKTSLMKALGFGYVRHGIDSELYWRGRPRGLTLYSTHRYNYVRVRHGDHTYNAKDSDFMSRAHPEKVTGLNLDKFFI